METMIRRCAELHLEHIRTSGDPFEMGSARPLDYGHWAAHKLEIMSDHRVRHGEAVAIGMILDARYALMDGTLPEADFDRLWRVLGAIGLPRWEDALATRAPDGRPAVLDGLAEFREHLGGELTITLLTQIGRGIEVHEIDESIMTDCLQWLQDQPR
jgi:3-dehydroquinate synthase